MWPDSGPGPGPPGSLLAPSSGAQQPCQPQPSRPPALPSLTAPRAPLPPAAHAVSEAAGPAGRPRAQDLRGGQGVSGVVRQGLLGSGGWVLGWSTPPTKCSLELGVLGGWHCGASTRASIIPQSLGARGQRGGTCVPDSQVLQGRVDLCWAGVGRADGWKRRPAQAHLFPSF